MRQVTIDAEDKIIVTPKVAHTELGVYFLLRMYKEPVYKSDRLFWVSGTRLQWLGTHNMLATIGPLFESPVQAIRWALSERHSVEEHDLESQSKTIKDEKAFNNTMRALVNGVRSIIGRKTSNGKGTV